jgi:beta-lactamase regulating signal transducer with metallopeptidase domain
MAAIDTWLRQPAAQAVGWALLQFVWQGAAVGVLTALALAALRRSAADVRYVVASIGLALMLTLPIVTGAQRYQSLRLAAASVETAAVVFHKGELVGDGFRLRFDRGELLAADAAPQPRSAASAIPAPSDGFGAIVPILLVAWSIGVTLLTLRLLAGWIWVQRLRTHGVMPAAAAWQDMAVRLSRQLHISRTIALLDSTRVDVPTVIGFLKPVILLPATALAGLTAQQLEAILAHELAHIRRHDYLVNLLQTLVETILFYHPGVWWLSRRIRIERENCCDDLAVSLCGDPVAYATALADLEALRSSGPVPDHHIAMAATGGSLLDRVRRLLGAPSSHSGRGPAWLAGTVALLLIGGIAGGADRLRAERAAQSPQASTPVVAPVDRFSAGDERQRNQEPVQAGVLLQRERAAEQHAGSERWKREAERWQPEAERWKSEAERWKPQADGNVGGIPQVTPAIASIPTLSMPIAPVPAIASMPIASAPAAPAAKTVQASVSHNTNDSSGNWIWSNNGEKLQVSYRGTFEFNDDDTDVRQISSGGWLKISDGNWLGRHAVEIRERGGQLEHLYYVNASERPYEPEGRLWLQQNLPKFVRNTGLGAEGRVARLLKTGGPAAVLTEIGRIDSSYAKGIYFKQLLKQGTLTPDQYRQVMTQASREMRSSSYELAQLLIAAAENLPNDEASRAAYFAAAVGISSDYELRRVYSAMLKRGPVSPEILGGILANAKSISSDYELSELLRLIMSQQALDDRNRAAFFNAAATIDSAYERHRVLSAVISKERPSEPALLEAALAAGASINSSYETSQFLQEVLRQNGVEGRVRAPFFAAVGRIGSNYETGRVLQMVAKKPGVSNDTLRAVLQASRALSGYELSQLLQAVAATHVIGSELRDAYLDAADRLSGYEQGQVMTALVKSERRK